LHRGSSAHLKVTGQETYTEEEKRVLLQTSHINQKEYVPFMNVDLGERFQYSLQFTDRDGHLALSPKQQRDFVRWARPDEIFSEPKMVIGQHVDCFSIKQTVRYITKDNFPNFMFVSLDMNIVDIMIF
jgi:calpain-7